jgi:hypothetical protein
MRIKRGSKVKLKETTLKLFAPYYTNNEMAYYRQIHTIKGVSRQQAILTYSQNHPSVHHRGQEWVMNFNDLICLDEKFNGPCDCSWLPCKSRREETKSDMSKL